MRLSAGVTCIMTSCMLICVSVRRVYMQGFSSTHPSFEDRSFTPLPVIYARGGDIREILCTVYRIILGFLSTRRIRLLTCPPNDTKNNVMIREDLKLMD